MALRDYYRCKSCDAKIAYGPDRPEEDWEPFLLCRECISRQGGATAELIKSIEGMRSYFHSFAEDGVRPDEWIMREWVGKCDKAIATAEGVLDPIVPKQNQRLRVGSSKPLILL